MKKFIKKFIGEFLLILGVGLFVYNVFSFQSVGYGATQGTSWSELPWYLLDSPKPNYQCFAYYYLNDTKIMIVVGAVLITIGILVIRNKKEI